jgi:hypothetical protein
MSKKEEQYIVSQCPKAKYAAGMHTVVMIVSASSKAEAVRKAVEKGQNGAENWFGPSAECNTPKADLLKPDTVYAF